MLQYLLVLGGLVACVVAGGGVQGVLPLFLGLWPGLLALALGLLVAAMFAIFRASLSHLESATRLKAGLPSRTWVGLVLDRLMLIALAVRGSHVRR